MDALFRMLIQDYLRGEKPLHSLQVRLADVLFQEGCQPDKATRDLADEITLLVAEHTGGFISEAELKKAIGQAADSLIDLQAYLGSSRDPMTTYRSAGRTVSQRIQAEFA